MFQLARATPTHLTEGLLRGFFRCRLACAGLMLLCLPLTAAFAQPPQDATPPLTGLTPPDTAGLSEVQTLVLRSIRDQDPQVGDKILSAAEALYDVQLYRDTRVLLQRLERQNLDEDAQLALVESMGSSFLQKISLDSQLQPEGRRVARALFTGARSASRKPERIQSLIDGLATTDQSARNLAIRRLQQIGPLAGAELLSRFANPDFQDSFDSWHQVLLLLGPEMPGPVLAGARAADPLVQAESLRILASMPTPEARELLTWIKLSPQRSDVLKEIATRGLETQNIQVDADQAEQQLFARAKKFVTGQLTLPNQFDETTTVWNWDSQQQKLVAYELPSDTANRLVAARQASRLYEIRPDEARNRLMYLVTQLESVKRIAGPSRAIDVEQVMQLLRSTPAEINTVLAHAIDLELYPSAIACCEILKEYGEESLLHRKDGRPSALIRALLSGDRATQFAAFDAIQNMEPQQPFVGSSFVLSFAVFLTQGSQKSVALVGHRDQGEGQTYAAEISNHGVQGLSASSSRQLFELATNNPDIEMLLVSDTLAHPDYGNLVQQLRNDWRTRTLPIAMLYSDIDHGQDALRQLENDSRFVAVPFSTDSGQVGTTVRRLSTRIRPFRITPLMRQRHAAVAIRWLAKVAGNRESYRFYDIGNHHSELTGLIYQDGFVEQASTILSSIGTPDAQRQLVDFASQSNLPVDQRLEVVQAFAESVARGGTLLTTDEIKLQYDRYNATVGNQQAADQQVLGAILDAIESIR